ncbi:MAG: DEAD/DEAH box helicase [Longimicrobiales bacterium]
MTWWRAARDPERIERVGVVRPATTHTHALFADALAERSVVAYRALTLPPARYYLRDPPAVRWPHVFRPFQREGIAALLGRDTLLLADDMGLGKTVQAVAALRVLFRRRDIEDALIVGPAAIMTQWSRTLRAWAPELRISLIRGSAAERAWQWRAPAHVFLTSYETLRSDLTDNPHSPPRRRVWGVVALDEAQKIKNRDTDLSRACKRIPRQRAWALTGTPLENRLDDLASICEFLTPLRDGMAPPRFEPDDRLLAVHASVQLRRRKADVLPELPPRIEIDLPVGLRPEQRRSYERARDEGLLWLRRLGRTVTVTHVLELILRLKQVCNFDPETGASAKLDDLEDRLETLRAAGYKTLVFSQFVDDSGIAKLQARLARFAPITYTGALTIAERDHAIRRFREGPPDTFMIVSLRAGGFGLDLPEASYVFHFDRWWNPSVERQAEDRAHRLGRTGPVTAYRYITEHTIEERIDQLIREKQALFDSVVDRVSLDPQRVFTADELFGLLGLSPPA